MLNGGKACGPCGSKGFPGDEKAGYFKKGTTVGLIDTKITPRSFEYNKRRAELLKQALKPLLDDIKKNAKKKEHTSKGLRVTFPKVGTKEEKTLTFRYRIRDNNEEFKPSVKTSLYNEPWTKPGEDPDYNVEFILGALQAKDNDVVLYVIDEALKEGNWLLAALALATSEEMRNVMTLRAYEGRGLGMALTIARIEFIKAVGKNASFEMRIAAGRPGMVIFGHAALVQGYDLEGGGLEEVLENKDDSRNPDDCGPKNFTFKCQKNKTSNSCMIS
jgi:hypothetical protein